MTPNKPIPAAPALPDVAEGEKIGSNYVANRECRPTEVRFENGRRVYIKQDDDGPFLQVEMMKPGEAWLRNAAEAEDGGFIGAGDTPYNRAVHAIVQAGEQRGDTRADLSGKIAKLSYESITSNAEQAEQDNYKRGFQDAQAMLAKEEQGGWNEGVEACAIRLENYYNEPRYVRLLREFALKPPTPPDSRKD